VEDTYLLANDVQSQEIRGIARCIGQTCMSRVGSAEKHKKIHVGAERPSRNQDPTKQPD
jgi:hypothetical protein